MLDAVTRPHGTWPTPVLAALYARHYGVQQTPHLRASISRAIRRLDEQGRVATVWYKLPTAILANARPTGDQWTVCVAAPGTDFDSTEAYAFARAWALDVLLHNAGAELENILKDGS